MTNIFDANSAKLIQETAEELKKLKEMQPPEWAKFVKTGPGKERTPSEKDWWYTRAASVLRTIFKKGPIGVSKLRTKYGNKKNRGVKPEKFTKASGNILRKILQQLEKAGLAKQTEKGVHKGRITTPKGISLLSKAAKKTIISSKSESKTEKTVKIEKTDKKEQQKNAEKTASETKQEQ